MRLSGCPVEGTFSVHPRGRPRGELQEAESGAEGGAALRRQGFDGEDAPSPITRRTTVTSACVSNGSAKS